MKIGDKGLKNSSLFAGGKMNFKRDGGNDRNAQFISLVLYYRNDSIRDTNILSIWFDLKHIINLKGFKTGKTEKGGGRRK